MKKKIIAGFIAGLLIASTLINFRLTEQNSKNEIMLDDVILMAQAGNESAIGSFTNSIKDWWNSEIYDCIPEACTKYSPSGYIGVGTGGGASVSASTGYTYDEYGNWVPTTSISASVGLIVSADVSITITTSRGTVEECYGGSSVAHCWECKWCS